MRKWYIFWANRFGGSGNFVVWANGSDHARRVGNSRLSRGAWVVRVSVYRY